MFPVHVKFFKKADPTAKQAVENAAGAHNAVVAPAEAPDEAIVSCPDESSRAGVLRKLSTVPALVAKVIHRHPGGKPAPLPILKSPEPPVVPPPAVVPAVPIFPAVPISPAVLTQAPHVPSPHVTHESPAPVHEAPAPSHESPMTAHETGMAHDAGFNVPIQK